jgi:high-affinity iron transporter
VKTVFNFICTLALVAAGSARGLAVEDAAPSGKAVERLAALVDYVAADYPGAVKNGQVIAESELAEQQGMLSETEALVEKARPLDGHAQAGAELTRELGVLLHDFHAHAREEQVAADCRAIHKRLIDDYGLVLAPLAPPSEERARAVYAVACASCHGADGHADTEQAAKLKPPPLSFFDGERMARISPSLAFHALTFGVGGTAMASFDTLPASDRWSLAFYVVGLRHEKGDLERGARLAVEGRVPVAASASRLAELSDAQLDERLREPLPDAADRAAAVAHLRRVAAFAKAPGGDFAEARRLLGEVAAAAATPARARELAVAAYLEGVEPHEATLRARDRAVADRIERAFFELRQAIDAGGGPEPIRREVARATLVLDGAEERGRGGPSVPFFAALAIALREGFELSLLLAALLAFVRKSGRAAPSAARAVHLGWLSAVPAGVATWFLVGAAIGGARRELTEGVLTLVAAAMLLFVSHFVLGRLESHRWLKFLERKVTAAGARTAEAGGGSDGGAGAHWSLAAVAFVAAYREAIEVVLFFRALVLDAPGRGWAILAGAATGIAALTALVKLMSVLGRRLNPRPLMQASSVLLTAIAVSLVGQGVRALQEGGYLHLSPLPPGVPSAPVLGLYATVEGVAAQAVVLALAIVPAWLEKRSRARAQSAKLA